MSRRVLIVDDSATIRDLIGTTLEEAFDVETIESDNGFNALKQLPLESFDLIITDINMPQINGLELLQFIQTNDRYSKIPVIIVTTEGQARDRQKGLALGAVEYIAKPFAPETLVKIASNYLEPAE